MSCSRRPETGSACWRPSSAGRAGDVLVPVRVDRPRRRSGGAAVPTAVLVISDGANQGSRVTPQAAAARARTAHIPVYTVLVGTRDGIVERTLTGGYREQIRVPASPDTLRQLAQATQAK